MAKDSIEKLNELKESIREINEIGLIDFSTKKLANIVRELIDIQELFLKEIGEGKKDEEKE